MSKITIRAALTDEQYDAFVALPGKSEDERIKMAIACWWEVIRLARVKAMQQEAKATTTDEAAQ